MSNLMLTFLKALVEKFFLDISVQGNIIIIEKKILFTEIR